MMRMGAFFTGMASRNPYKGRAADPLAKLEQAYPHGSKVEVVVKSIEGDRVSLTLPSVVAAQEEAAAAERDAQAALRANRESARTTGFGNLGSLLDAALARED